MQSIDLIAPGVTPGVLPANNAAPVRPAPAANRLSFAQHLELRQDMFAPVGKSGERGAPGTEAGVRLVPPAVLGEAFGAEPPRTEGRIEAEVLLTADTPQAAVQELLAQWHGEQARVPAGDPLLHPDRPVRLPPTAADAASGASGGARAGWSGPSEAPRQRAASEAPAAAAGVERPVARALPGRSNAASPSTPSAAVPARGDAPEPVPSDDAALAFVGPLDMPVDAGTVPAAAGIETRPSATNTDAAPGPEPASTSPATSSATSAGAAPSPPDPATLALLAGAAPRAAAANPMAGSTAAAANNESARTASTTATASGPSVAVALREGRADDKAALGRRTTSVGRVETSPVDARAHESPIEPALALAAPLPGHDRALPAAAPAKDFVAPSADSARATLETAVSRPADEPAPAAAQTAAALPVASPPALLGGSDPMRAPTLPLDVALPVPVGSAHFREALNVQVSVLARDGVHHAELHLNPADMGPLSVQITLDGQQAQVHFGSDSALTRQIVETGLPSLAAALRDAGLTLSGGGVSQHAHGQRQVARQSPSRPEDGPPASEPELHSVRTLRLPTGRLDTYA